MKKPIYLILIVYLIIEIFIIYFFDGTGDGGDSIYHYLFAKYAVVHPELFFDHWAKPVFVLLASPFAQFGINGIKLFNSLVSLLTIYFTYKTAESLSLKNAIVSILLIIFIPLYFIQTFSGLTEHLFGLFTIISFYFLGKNKYLLSCIILSFLPFIRSEGLIFIGLFGLFMIYKKQWKVVPFLFFGSVIYSIGGYFVHHDFLWVFTKIPYANLSSQYGSGKLFHFVDQLYYVLGLPIYAIFLAGVLSIVIEIVKFKIYSETKILILIAFLCYLTAHSLFWYLGIFNSMGLKRVMIGVSPLIAIIALNGFNFITEILIHEKKKIKYFLKFILITYIIIFPFTSNPAAIKWERDLKLSKEQQYALDAVKFIKNKSPEKKRIIYSHPYLLEVLNQDFYIDNNWRLTNENINNLKSGEFIIWENWFAVVESGIPKIDLDNNNTLANIYSKTINYKGGIIIYVVYEKK